MPLQALLPSLLPLVTLVLVSLCRPDLPTSQSDLLLLAAAVLFGVVAGTACNFATQLKFVFGYDDALDVSCIYRHVTKNILLPIFF